MSDLLDQNAIDELLSSAFSDDDITSDSDFAVERDIPAQEKGQGKSHFKGFKRKHRRFHYQYNSPLIKQENVIINPDASLGNIENIDRPVVRTLKNYIQFKNLKNKRG